MALITRPNPRDYIYCGLDGRICLLHDDVYVPFEVSHTSSKPHFFNLILIIYKQTQLLTGIVAFLLF